MSDFDKLIYEVSRKVYFDVPQGTHLTPESEVRRVLLAIRAAGWAVVPRKATKEMTMNAEDFILLHDFARNRARKIWSAMLAAGEVHDD